MNLAILSFQKHHRPSKITAGIGPATRCNAVHLRCDIPKLLRCRKTACDALRCKFQHVQYFAPDFDLSQPFAIRFSNSTRHCDWNLMSFHVICASKILCYIFLITIAAMNIAGENRNLPSWLASWPHCCDFLRRYPR